MAIKFSKYHGCGNDFICVDARRLSMDWVAVAKQWCRRRFSVGADGLVLLESSNVADIKMTIINADGTIPEMCGNGLRCLAVFAIHQQIVTTLEFSVETLAGILTVQLIEDNQNQYRVSVSMGQAKVQLDLPTKDFALDLSLISHDINIEGQDYTVIPVSMGNPHVVVFVPDVQAIDLPIVGAFLENHEWFPNQANIEFVSVQSKNQITMRVWERGVGETLACGTGACAAVVAGVVSGQLAQSVSVTLLGGQLDICVNRKDLCVTMVGPASFVFESEI